MNAKGRIVLTQPNGNEQSFDLAKTQISIGRDPVCDIVLSDSKVSRSHARLEFVDGEYIFVDLGSANGSHLNGDPVQRAALSWGDILRIGDNALRFETVRLSESQDIYQIDTLAELEETIAQETIHMTIYDTDKPRIVVYMPEKTWEFTLTEALTTIGRDPHSDICIPHTKVSRNQAQIEYQDDQFVIKDLQSSNGTWLGAEAIDQHRLQNGDTVRIGSARLVYKAAFESNDLTLVEDPLAKSSGKGERIPVVFVPGFMGSELWLGNERIWPNVRYLFSEVDIFDVSKKAPIAARGVLNEVVIVPNLVKLEQYNRLGDYLVESLGYQRQVDLMEFAYDWRQDVRLSARCLAQAIQDWDISGPVILIAHSLGSLVTRYYIEHLGGKNRVRQAIFMGGPHYGVPKAIASLRMKADLLPFGILGDRLRDILSTFPSFYQILPIYNSVFDQNDQPIQVFEDESWLLKEQLPLLREARQFRRELGRRLSVPAVSIFGYGLKTVQQIAIHRDSNGNWTKMDMVVGECGDTTIPDNSTILDGSEIHPVGQHHGSLYVDNDVRMRLKLELTHQRQRA